MIVQAIGLLDDLDKEINIYAMRVREWYGKFFCHQYIQYIHAYVRAHSLRSEIYVKKYSMNVCCESGDIHPQCSVCL